MNGKETLRIAKVLLRSHNWEIRAKGLDMLARLEDESHLSLVEASLSDQVQVIRDKAVKVLEKLRSSQISAAAMVSPLSVHEEIQ